MVGGGNLTDEVSDVNFITRGTKVFGSVHVGNEICDFRPDWAGNGMVAKCKSESEYPPKDEPKGIEEDKLIRSRLLATNPAQDPLNFDGAYNYGWRDLNARFRDIMVYECK